jgi:hypothetical protein
MTQPTKREQLDAMRVEDFKAHLRAIAGEDSKTEISGAARPNPCAQSQEGSASAKAKEALSITASVHKQAANTLEQIYRDQPDAAFTSAACRKHA